MHRRRRYSCRPRGCVQSRSSAHRVEIKELLQAQVTLITAMWTSDLLCIIKLIFGCISVAGSYRLTTPSLNLRSATLASLHVRQWLIADVELFFVGFITPNLNASKLDVCVSDAVHVRELQWRDPVSHKSSGLVQADGLNSFCLFD